VDRVIANINDGSDAAPRLRCDLNIGNTWLLPAWSEGPDTVDPTEVLTAVKAAGFEGVQGGDALVGAELDLAVTAFGVARAPGELADSAKLWCDLGMEAATVHVGTGLEDDDAALALFDEVIQLSVDLDFPIYVETHRATLTQDIWRTVRFTEKLPELRFNGDWSHWYTGLEMTYGDFEEKLDFIEPVFERTRFMHGRIGDPGCIQIDIGDSLDENTPPSVDHFRQFWTRSFAGFLATAGPGDIFPFAPELLPSEINYARTVPSDDGPREEGDRWTQAQLYCTLARECFTTAETAHIA
jgi:hypothetical protein